MKEEIKATNKFKKFKAICECGDIIELKSPQSKVTLKTALKYASHWAKKQQGVIVNIIAVKGVE